MEGKLKRRKDPQARNRNMNTYKQILKTVLASEPLNFAHKHLPKKIAVGVSNQEDRDVS